MLALDTGPVTVNLKDIMQFMFLIGGMFGAYYAVKSRITILEQLHGLRLDRIDGTIAAMSTDMKTQGKQDTEITQLRREIDQNRRSIERLRHWKDFVTPDGEYHGRDVTPTEHF